MIEFRWVLPKKSIGGQPEKKLQYRFRFYPMLIASGDIVLRQLEEHESKWEDIPEIVE